MPLGPVMKTKILTVIFSAAFLTPAFSQNSKIDSLINILTTAAEDTNKVNLLNDISRRLWGISRYEESKTYANEALALSGHLNFKRGTAYAYINLAITYRKEGNFSEALINAKASLKIGEETGDKNILASCYSNLGVIYKNQGNFEEALKYYRSALKNREEVGDKAGTGPILSNIGTSYQHLGDYPEALKYLLAGLKITKEAGDNRGVAMGYGNIGVIYGIMKNYDEALGNFFLALTYSQKTDDKISITAAYSNIGITYKDKGNYSEALKHLQLALQISEEIGNKDQVATCYSNIGIVYNSMVDYPEALKNYLAGLAIQEEIGNKNNIALSYGNIGKQYTQLNNYTEARRYLLKSLTLSKEIGLKTSIKATYLGLAGLDSAMGNYSQAFENYKLYTIYQDSLLNETTNKEITRMKEQYESEKKDNEILQLEGEKEKLESEKQINALLLKAKEDSLNISQAENSKVHAVNLYNEQQIALLSNEKKIQQLQIEKDQAEYAAQKAEADKKQEQLVALSKEKDIQMLEAKKQKQTKNYFIAGLVLVLVLSFFIYRNYRTRQQLKLQTLRNKIASDLHDDVGSTLSSISMFAQMAQSQSKEVIPALETIGESSRKMLDAMADIVWTINPENDQFEKIIMRMQSFAFDLLGTKKIDFEFDADDDVANYKLSMEAKKNLYLIFKEATNNMVKYAEASKAMFAIKGKKEKLTMMISDNGKGFDATKEFSGNGLKNMKRRAIEIGARLLVDSMPGSGTTIKLELAV